MGLTRLMECLLKMNSMCKLHKHNSQWLAGGLNTSRIMGSTHWPTLEKQLLRNIGFESSRTKLIKGFYNDSLREGPRLAWRLGMRPALLVDIDCDLYTSSKQALTFMLESGLLVPGTFVYYDDFSIVDWARLPYKEERACARGDYARFWDQVASAFDADIHGSSEKPFVDLAVWSRCPNWHSTHTPNQQVDHSYSPDTTLPNDLLHEVSAASIVHSCRTRSGGFED